MFALLVTAVFGVIELSSLVLPSSKGEAGGSATEISLFAVEREVSFGAVAAVDGTIGLISG